MSLREEFAGKKPREYTDDARIARTRIARLLDVSDMTVLGAVSKIRGKFDDVEEEIPDAKRPNGHINGVKVAYLPQILEAMAPVMMKRDWTKPAEYIYPWARKAVADLRETGQCTIERHTRRGTNRVTFMMES